MTRITRAWGALAPEQRLAAVAAVALLVTMFFPWYDLQSLNPKTHAINSHSISAFGDVSFVEAAVFLVAAGVIALLFARAERKDFHMPGSDGTIVMIAGGWATLLIFYRVFSRPAGHGYPVGIDWGFLLAFLAAGVLTFAGWRMRSAVTPEAPLLRGRGRRRTSEHHLAGEETTVVASSPPRVSGVAPADVPPSATDVWSSPADIRPVPAKPRSPAPVTPRDVDPSEEVTSVVERSPQPPASTPHPSPSTQRPPSSTTPAAARRASGTARKRPRFPPAPSDQLSFEDQPPEQDKR